MFYQLVKVLCLALALSSAHAVGSIEKVSNGAIYLVTPQHRLADNLYSAFRIQHNGMDVLPAELERVIKQGQSHELTFQRVHLILTELSADTLYSLVLSEDHSKLHHVFHDPSPNSQPGTFVTRSIELASARPIVPSANLEVEGHTYNYDIKQLVFGSNIKLTSNAAIEDAINVSISNGAVEQAKNEPHSLEAIREQIREQIYNATPEQIAEVRKRYPGLQWSARQILQAVDDHLALEHEMELMAVDQSQVLKQLEDLIFRVAVNTQSLLHISSYDQQVKTENLSSEDHKRFTQLTAAQRMNQLLMVFLEVIEETAEARAQGNQELVQDLSAEALQVALEIHVVAGITQGSTKRLELLSAMVRLSPLIGVMLLGDAAGNDLGDFIVTAASSAGILMALPLIKVFKNFEERQTELPWLSHMEQWHSTKELLTKELEIPRNPSKHVTQQMLETLHKASQLPMSEVLGQLGICQTYLSGK